MDRCCGWCCRPQLQPGDIRVRRGDSAAIRSEGEGSGVRSRRRGSGDRRRRGTAPALLEADRGENRTSKTANWRVSSRGTRGSHQRTRGHNTAASDARTGSGLGKSSRDPRGDGEQTAQRVQNKQAKGHSKHEKRRRRRSAPLQAPRAMKEPLVKGRGAGAHRGQVYSDAERAELVRLAAVAALPPRPPTASSDMQLREVLSPLTQRGVKLEGIVFMIAHRLGIVVPESVLQSRQARIDFTLASAAAQLGLVAPVQTPEGRRESALDIARELDLGVATSQPPQQPPIEVGIGTRSKTLADTGQSRQNCPTQETLVTPSWRAGAVDLMGPHGPPVQCTNTNTDYRLQVQDVRRAI